ncbi:hypothetical protein MSAN_00470500 [Mycena sanguinolenta]|uniref:Uncharacterized protein n=1 Tax=Mycena sanguinolenta TaxID=230812 RepID=A0A8H7DJP1_9AGAR|nr:hypothetical protein MSAN_00470500 [Mycena sanguinolenta]
MHGPASRARYLADLHALVLHFTAVPSYDLHCILAHAPFLGAAEASLQLLLNIDATRPSNGSRTRLDTATNDAHLMFALATTLGPEPAYLAEPTPKSGVFLLAPKRKRDSCEMERDEEGPALKQPPPTCLSPAYLRLRLLLATPTPIPASSLTAVSACTHAAPSPSPPPLNSNSVLALPSRSQNVYASPSTSSHYRGGTIPPSLGSLAQIYFHDKHNRRRRDRIHIARLYNSPLFVRPLVATLFPPTPLRVQTPTPLYSILRSCCALTTSTSHHRSPESRFCHLPFTLICLASQPPELRSNVNRPQHPVSKSLILLKILDSGQASKLSPNQITPRNPDLLELNVHSPYTLTYFVVDSNP